MGVYAYRERRFYVSKHDSQVYESLTPHIIDRISTELLCCSVNGGSSVLVDQLNTGGGGVVMSVPVKLNLRSGSNSITFSANQNSEHYGPESV